MIDITFCNNFECMNRDCRRHQLNKPTDEYLLSVSNFYPDKDGNCKSYLDGRSY